MNVITTMIIIHFMIPINFYYYDYYYYMYTELPSDFAFVHLVVIKTMMTIAFLLQTVYSKGKSNAFMLWFSPSRCL